jgi:hypothetical protein
MTEQITNPDTHNAMLILGFFMPAGSVLDITADQLIERCTPTQLDRIAGCLWYLQPPSVEQARFAAALVHQLVPLLGLVGANVATLHLVINNRELNDQDIDALVRIMWLMDVRLGHRKLLVKYLWGAVRDAGRTWQGMNWHRELKVYFNNSRATGTADSTAVAD